MTVQDVGVHISSNHVQGICTGAGNTEPSSPTCRAYACRPGMSCDDGVTLCKDGQVVTNWTAVLVNIGNIS